MSEEKFSKCEEGEKCLSVEFRVFGKKRKLKEKFRRKKKMFWVEILLSSFSLVGLYINLQAKVAFKKKMEIFKVFFRPGFVPYTRWGAML